jgi:hypothetical protein
LKIGKSLFPKPLGQFSPSGPLPSFSPVAYFAFPARNPFPQSISSPFLVPACPSEQPTGPACLYRRPPWSRPETNQSQGANPCSLQNLHRISVEIESNMLAMSRTEKPYKKSPRRSSIPLNPATNPSLAPRRHCAIPPPFLLQPDTC